MNSSFDLPPGLPPFETLPAESRRAIVRAIVREDRWRMAGYELGGVHAAATRALRTLASKVRVRPASELMRLLVSTVQSGPARGVHAIFRAARRLARPFCRDGRILRCLACSLHPWDLAVRYAEGIPQAPEYRGYWHDASRDNTVGMVLGVDFIPSPEGYWFVESNLDAALREQRSALYDSDPFVTNLVDFAASRGYEHLVVVPGNTVPVDPRMFARYQDEAARRGLRLTVVEDKFLPGARSPRSLRLPKFSANRTFVARVRRYHTALDHLVADKVATDRALRIYLRESGDRSFRLPKTGSLEEAFAPAGDEPFPNLVYKFAELDQGQAVVFLKARSLDRARSLAAQAADAARPRGLTSVLVSRIGPRTGLFQAYARSAPAPGGRLFIYRAHVLVSPVGTRFLSAHRVVAAEPVPESLPEGVVGNPRPYLVNYSAGAHYESVSREEEESASRAVLGVAAGLARAVEIGFEVASAAPSGAYQDPLPRIAGEPNR